MNPTCQFDHFGGKPFKFLHVIFVMTLFERVNMRQREVVDVHGLVTERSFAAEYRRRANTTLRDPTPRLSARPRKQRPSRKSGIFPSAGIQLALPQLCIEPVREWVFAFLQLHTAAEESGQDVPLPLRRLHYK